MRFPKIALVAMIIGALFIGCIGCQDKAVITTSCPCSPWNPLVVTWNGNSPETQTVNCSGMVDDLTMIYSGTPISISASFGCGVWIVDSSTENASSGSSTHKKPINSYSCPASYGWTVMDPLGVIIGSDSGSGTSFQVVFYPTDLGIHTVNLNASCDKTTCERCQIRVNIKQIVNNPCNCSDWIPTYFQNKNHPESEGINASCGNTVNWPQDMPMMVTSGVPCSPANCSEYYSWSVSSQSGAVVESGSGPVLDFTLPTSIQPGLYTLIENATCGDTNCEPCIIYINWGNTSNPTPTSTPAAKPMATGTPVIAITPTPVTWSAPVLAGPFQGQTVSPDGVSLRWYPVGGDINYQIQIGTDSGFGSADLIVNETINTEHYYFTSTLPAGTYYWHVRVIDVGTGAESPWSDTQYFIVAQ